MFQHFDEMFRNIGLSEFPPLPPGIFFSFLNYFELDKATNNIDNVLICEFDYNFSVEDKDIISVYLGQPGLPAPDKPNSPRDEMLKKPENDKPVMVCCFVTNMNNN